MNNDFNFVKEERDRIQNDIKHLPPDQQIRIIGHYLYQSDIGRIIEHQLIYFTMDNWKQISNHFYCGQSNIPKEIDQVRATLEMRNTEGGIPNYFIKIKPFIERDNRGAIKNPYMWLLNEINSMIHIAELNITKLPKRMFKEKPKLYNVIDLVDTTNKLIIVFIEILKEKLFIDYNSINDVLQLKESIHVKNNVIAMSIMEVLESRGIITNLTGNGRIKEHSERILKIFEIESLKNKKDKHISLKDTRTPKRNKTPQGRFKSNYIDQFNDIIDDLINPLNI